MPFEFMNSITTHVVVHTADQRMNPPPAYLFVQDALVYFTGIMWALCYTLFMLNIRRTRVYVWTAPFILLGNLAFELFFSIVVPKSRFERLLFPTVFLLDVALVTTVILYGTPNGKRWERTISTVVTTSLFLSIIWTTASFYPDDGQNFTGYWLGLLLELPVGYQDVYIIWHQRDTKGHAIEVWLTRNIGDLAAYGVFFWRYVNIPENWGYVGSRWSIAIIMATFLPEVLFPFVYLHLKSQKSRGPRDRTTAQEKEHFI